MRIKLAKPLPLQEIARVTGGTLNISSSDIEYIVTDTREAQVGDLFFALQGEHTSGEKFIEEARRLGAYTVGEGGDISLSDTRHALLTLASYCKSKLEKLTHTIAITGSVGKSTAKEILGSILSRKYKLHKTFENFNNILGVSYTLLSAPIDCEVLVVELGMNHRGEISELSAAVKPDVAIITNIGTAHIGNLGSREAIAEAKLEIKSGLCGKLIVPYDEMLLSGENALKFSTAATSADVCVKKDENFPHTQVYKIYEHGKFTGSVLKTDSEHMAYATAAALLAARQLNSELENEYHFFSNSEQNIRQRLIKAEKFDIMCDFYNASFESFISGFKYVLSLNYAHRSALIGDILELGSYSQAIHFSLGKAAAELCFERLYVFGEFSLDVKAGAVSIGFPEEKIYINRDITAPEITARQILSTVKNGELLYAKASHKLDLARITNLLCR